MTRRIPASLVCLIVAAAPVPAAFGENDGEALAVGVPVDQCPIFYVDADTGEAVGIGVDLMRYAAEAAGYGLTPDQLHIEITETAYVENPKFLIGTTEKLRSMGFQVEMDDFGSGYSSLHMLKEVPVDRIKLDLHFLTASGDPEKSRTIVSCMIQMVHLLGMEMIAEGVETLEQAEFLKDKGCSEMQGFYFFKPMPVQEYGR